MPCAISPPLPNQNPFVNFAPRLNQLGLRWMAVGSIANNADGEFRTTTLALDVVLVLASEDAELS